jgi:three-Cys-motif partner protein
MAYFNPIILVKPDRLITPEIGTWGLSKYNYVGRYCDVFTQSMRSKWKHLVYIDLFAGSGYSKIKTKNQVVLGSPLIALSVPTKFTEYILCEADPTLCNALKTRVNRDFSFSKTIVINGNANKDIETVMDQIPRFSRQETGLSFTFIDPFSLSIHFESIRKLCNLRMDFLILLALHMDGNRNYSYYIEEENQKIELFLDNPHWRDQLRKVSNNETFVRFLASQFRNNMVDLGYKPTETFIPIRSDKKNLPLYYLAYFSKHDLGSRLWNEVVKYSSPQRKFF